MLIWPNSLLERESVGTRVHPKITRCYSQEAKADRGYVKVCQPKGILGALCNSQKLETWSRQSFCFQGNMQAISTQRASHNLRSNLYQYFVARDKLQARPIIKATFIRGNDRAVFTLFLQQ